MSGGQTARLGNRGGVGLVLVVERWQQTVTDGIAEWIDRGAKEMIWQQ